MNAKVLQDDDASGDRAVLCEDRAVVRGQNKPAASTSRLCSIGEEIENRGEPSQLINLDERS